MVSRKIPPANTTNLKKKQLKTSIKRGKQGNDEKESVIGELLKTHLKLPDYTELQIQQAQRALISKPAVTSSSRSITENVLQYCVKELILRKAWQQKIEMNDYAKDVIEVQSIQTCYSKAVLRKRKGSGTRH